MLLMMDAPMNGRSVVCNSLRGRFVMCAAVGPAGAPRSRPARLLRRTHRADRERRSPEMHVCGHIDR